MHGRARPCCVRAQLRARTASSRAPALHAQLRARAGEREQTAFGEREECVYLHSNAAEREKILMLLRERNSNGFGSAPANSNGFGIAPACRLDAKVRIRMDSAALQRAFARVVV